MAEEQGKTWKTVGGVMVLTLLGKLMGLWRDRLMALSYGTSMEANAFYTASRIPRVFFDTIFASAIALCLIPVLTRITQEEGEEAGEAFAGNFLTVMGGLTALLTGLGMLLAQPMVGFFADGYDLETQALAVELTRMMFPTVFLTGLAFTFVGLLQAKGRFFIPAFMSCLSNLVVILYFYLLNPQYGVWGLALAYLLGWGAQAVIQLPSLKQMGFRFRPSFSLKSPGMGQVFALMGPVLVSTWVQPINLTINTRFASHLYQGAGVTMMEIATNLYLILAGVFILSLTNVVFPRLSRLNHQGEAGDFVETLGQTLHIALFFTLPLTAGLWIVAEPLVELLYGGGEFDGLAVERTALALRIISLGMVGFALQNIVSRAYFAQEEGKTPLIAGALAILCNLVLCWALVGTWGLSGLALSSALSSLVYGLILLVALEQKQAFLGRGFWLDVGKMALVSLSMVFWGGWVLTLCLPWGRLLALGVTALVGLLGYGLLGLVLGLWECRLVLGLFPGKGTP